MSTNTITKKNTTRKETKPALQMIPLDQLVPSPQNTRRTTDRLNLKQLTESIRQQGVLQPILVRQISAANGSPAQFQIVAGERRWRAAQKAGLTEIPAQIKTLDETEALSAQIVENLQREDVHPLDEAEGFLRLQTEQQLSLKEIAARVAKDVRYVARRLSLTNLILEARNDFQAAQLTLAHALEIARLAPEMQPYALAACYEPTFAVPIEDDEEMIEEPRLARPVAVLLEWLKTNVYLNLNEAPFAMDDARLHEDGLTCLACPQRSGFNQSLFADIQGRDTCLNPICFQAKVKTLVNLRKSEIETKTKKTTTLISAFYGSLAERSGAVGRDEYQLIARKADRCAFAEPAVLSDGQDLGKEQWICRDETCKDHRGRILEASSKTTGNSSGTKQHRRQELFDVKVDEAVRQQVMREALPAFAWTLAREQWNEIGKEFFRRIPTEHQRTIGTVLGWEEAEGHRLRFDDAATLAKIAAFSEDELAQFLMLCSFAHYGANRDRRHAVDQSAVIALSQTCGVNHALIDATVRAEFCPKKYKEVHQAYLHAVQEGKPTSKPVIYEQREETPAPMKKRAAR